jgi:hypothetical protein
MGIVPTFDEFKHCLAGLWWIVEGAAIEQFAFQSGKEALAEGIVETIADRAHRWTDTGVSTALAERQGSVLAALVRVMDDIFWVTLLDRHAQGIHYQGGLEAKGHRPTDDFATPGIHDNGQVQATRPSRDVSNICDPQTVGSAGAEISLHQIGSRTCSWLSLGRVWGFSAADTLQTCDPHQASHPLAAHVKFVDVCQFGMNARRAIGAFRFLMDFMDPFAQLLIRLRSFRRLSLTPGVIATARDMQHTTHGFHWIEGLVRTHKLEDFGGTASVSRANQAAAFDKISRSSRSCLFSFRSRANSAFSSLVRPSCLWP